MVKVVDDWMFNFVVKNCFGNVCWVFFSFEFGWMNFDYDDLVWVFFFDFVENWKDVNVVDVIIGLKVKEDEFIL